MMSATTIFACFDQKLPTFDYGVFLYHVTHVSSYTTSSTLPPPLLFHRDKEHWALIGEDYLEDLKSKLKTSYLPDIEIPFVLETEEDVVRAHSLYLCHPVKLALDKICQSNIMCCSEVTTPMVDSKVRVDTIWYYERSDGGRETFAVVELKTPGTLDGDQFKSAGLLRKKSDESEKKWVERYKKVTDRLEVDNTGSLLKGNALIVTKQTGTYAFHFSTPYVACLDWQALVLFEFEKAEYGSCGDTVSDCFVRYGSNNTIRKSLFGFLCTAYKFHGGKFI